MAVMMIKSGLGLAVAVVACPIFAIGAGWFAMNLIRSNRTAVLSTLPVKAEQTVSAKLDGEVVVSLEIPQLSTEYRSWELEVIENGSRQTHHMKWGGPRATGAVKGFSTMKVPVGQLTLANPDTLTIRVKGLAADQSYADSQIVLTRPYLGRMALQIIGIVVCAIAALLSLLGGLWALGVLKT